MKENPTKLIEKVYIEEGCCEKEIIQLKETPWEKFLKGDTTTSLENVFHKFEKLLKKRWIVLENDLIYDRNIRACWLGLKQNNKEKFYISFGSVNKITLYQIEEKIKEKYKNNNLSIPTKLEVLNSLVAVNPNVVPFKVDRFDNNYKYSLKDIYLVICKDGGNIFKYSLGNFYFSSFKKISTYYPYLTYAIPILRLGKENDFNISNREVFFRFIAKDLIPIELKNDEEYLSLLETVYYDKKEGKYKMKKTEIIEDEIEISEEELIKKLLNEDKVRADLSPYDLNMLTGINQGHWSLWNKDISTDDRNVEVKLKGKLVARNPATDVNKGVVGIDFGTKSTVVVYQKNSAIIHPMKIGTGEIYKKVSPEDYENPTIMEFRNLKKFVKDYNSKEYKPETKWNDLTISHTANNALKGSAPKEVNTFLTELKQWAGDKYKQLKLIDKNSYTLDLPPFLNIDEEFNPIEIYAYYLGLYINNQYNGIFLRYLLSFPVTYELKIREKIRESFERGLKKSLPPQLDKSYVDKLKVEEGASEPAAYAVVALEEYGFEREFVDENDDLIEDAENKKIFYGVFDFGGGTTDFDFGIFRLADEDNKKERKYDFVLEHFSAGGDRYLGGENLLELLAFEIFKKNKDELLANSIQFEKHPEKDVFAGSEALLSNSQEAKLNTKILMEKLRPFWENDPDAKEDFDEGVLKVNLTNREGIQLTSFELDIDKDELNKILSNRIERGVKAFFEKLKDSFKKREESENIDKINIFLAGNSSKSTILKELFNKEITAQEKIWKKDSEINIETDDEIFKIFEPLKSDEDNIEKPTGKTGVAFGLIKSKKSGNILVIDKNIEEDENSNEKEIGFKFYLGKARMKKFRIFPNDTDEEKWKYNEWKEFTDASVDQFEIYYTSNSLATTNKLSINDETIKKEIIDLDETDDEAYVYIRLVSPTEIEYVVSEEEPDDNLNSDRINIIALRD
jgi:hypothetical protein